MAPSVTKKVRLDPERARRLRRLARDLGTTESEVLREALDMMDRVRARQRNVEALIALAGDAEPEKVRFDLR